ncbi:MAG: SDR family NAD(P)-dependent oxidoreductase [Chloroflexota bacterium]
MINDRAMVNHSSIPIEEQVCLVIGGGHGRGRRVAETLAKAGVKAVAITYRENREEAHETYLNVQALGSICLLAQMDPTQRRSVRRVLLWITDHVGRIDVLVNAEEERWPEPMRESASQEIRRAIDVNLRAPLLCADEVMPFMAIQQTGGLILSIGMDEDTSAALHAVEGKRAPSTLDESMGQARGYAASRGVTIQLLPRTDEEELAAAVLQAVSR